MVTSHPKLPHLKAARGGDSRSQAWGCGEDPASECYGHSRASAEAGLPCAASSCVAATDSSGHIPTYCIFVPRTGLGCPWIHRGASRAGVQDGEPQRLRPAPATLASLGKGLPSRFPLAPFPCGDPEEANKCGEQMLLSTAWAWGATPGSQSSLSAYSVPGPHGWQSCVWRHEEGSRGEDMGSRGCGPTARE